jgi:hypothetical protein
MINSVSDTSFFDDRGRRILTKPYRVFDTEDLGYYYIQNKDIKLDEVLENLHSAGIGKTVPLDKFKESLEKLKGQFLRLKAYSNLFKGVHLPFILPVIDITERNLSAVLVERFLPHLECSFKRRYPSAHFKAIMQGGSTLAGNLRVDRRSRYQTLLDAVQKSDVVGWYFPQALQQFDIDSQVSQIEELPYEPRVCVSGPMEIFSASIGKPDLLINNEGYAPILTMPAVQHVDDKLTLALKSYGPHLEFWCLSNMLTPGVRQISEQWAGGVTIFQNY